MKRLASFAAIGLALIACSADDARAPSAPDPASSTDDTEPTATTPPSAGDAGMPQGGCGSSAATIDVTPFAKCRDGGRCVPAAAVPDEEKKRLHACPDGGGFCVPEIFLATSGQYVPRTCKSIGGGEGRCLSRLFKDIDAQKDTLPQDACEADERCAPCYDPTDGKPTGACSLNACDAPKEPPRVFGECCKDMGAKPAGRCVPKAMIPTADQESLGEKECDDGELCAPAESMDPAWKPPTCTAENLLGEYEGVCVSNCIEKDFLTGIATAQGDCDDLHFCAPCKKPLIGTPTGAPGCGP